MPVFIAAKKELSWKERDWHCWLSFILLITFIAAEDTDLWE